MADVTISALTNRQPNNSAVFPYSEGGVTYNATLNQIIPTGVIMMWSGSIASVPSGWALCNGANGTPDLRERFIVGAGGDNPTVDGTAYSVGDTGGINSVTLTIAQIPPHSHNIPTWNGLGGAYEVPQGAYGYDYGAQSAPTTSVGGGASHENRPPYYALAYIMKL